MNHWHEPLLFHRHLIHCCSIPTEHSWGHPVYMHTLTNTFPRARGLYASPFFITCHLGSHTASSEDVSPFLEGRCCSTSPHITMQFITTFWCSYGVLAGVIVLRQPKQRCIWTCTLCIQILFTCLSFSVGALHQDSSTPLTRELYPFLMLRPNHFDIVLFPMLLLLFGILCRVKWDTFSQPMHLLI